MASDVLHSVRCASNSGLNNLRTSRSRLSGMTAQLGADGLDLLGDPLPELLTDVAGVQPQPAGEWVRLKRSWAFAQFSGW